MAEIRKDPDQFEMLLDDEGNPVALMNATLANTRGRNLAFALAAHCDNTDAVQDLLAKTARSMEAEEFRPAAIIALQTLSRVILSGVVETSRAQGVDSLPDLRFIASELGALDGEVI
ncbi:hypothetical protein [Umezawaea sp. Da 62-37]|uniref:hypothetical protein n=1 Tax=Umezawaea sp. Da 62-37 TaxID=3075927 RepID=UPI0028F7051D|nr:hypothetical protein [Umezawaea sp. Da 62-37]WNV89023.1 hypothetical protein RM788_12190 [Umezawaea sp. Da 62-37]